MRGTLLAMVVVVVGCRTELSQSDRDPHWTCAAFCLTEWDCNESGDSSSSGDLVISEGKTGADAYRALADQCKTAPHSRLVSQASCERGALIEHPAPLSLACARD